MKLWIPLLKGFRGLLFGTPTKKLVILIPAFAGMTMKNKYT